MKTFHILTAKYLPYTNHKPSRLVIHSARFNQRIVINCDEEVDITAAAWLRKHGFKIVGTGFVSDKVVIVSDTFKPLK
jgi:hypothetical protein